MSKDKGKAKEYFAVYEEYSRTLRSWFIAVGLGGPSLIGVLSRTSSGPIAFKSELIGGAMQCFYLGIVMQVVLMILNKTSAWLLYVHHDPSLKYKKGCWYRLAYKFSLMIWLDFIVDAITAVGFMAGTYRLIQALS